jgi:hypothetical protein
MYSNLSKFKSESEEEKKSFKILNKFIECQKKQKYKYIIDAEIICLQNRALIYNAQTKLPSSSLQDLTNYGLIKLKNEIFESSLNHKCSSRDCGFCFLRAGLDFYHPITHEKFKATGLVYVCKSTGLAHVCGPDNCNTRMIHTTAEGVVCRISGMCLGPVIRSGRFDNPKNDNIRHTNNNENIEAFNVNNNIQNELSCISDDSCIARNSYEHSKMMREKNKNNKKKNKKNSNNNNNNNKKSKLVCKSVMENNSKLSLFYSSRVNTKRKNRKRKTALNKTYINMKKRGSNINLIKSILSDNIYASNKDKINEKRIINREKDAEIELKKYYEICIIEKRRPIFTDIVEIHAKHTLSTYELLYPKFNQNINNDYDDLYYFSQCLIKLWDIISDSDYSKNNPLNIQECTVSLIYMLGKGFSPEIFINNKGIIIDSENEENYLKTLTVEFIPKHSFLEKLLVMESDIKQLSKSNIRGKKESKNRKDKYNVSIMRGEKEIRKCYTSILEKNINNIKNLQNYMLCTYIKIRSE